MTLSTSTVTLAPGSSRTYSLAPGEAVTVATEPNCYVTVTETPDVITTADQGGQTNVRTSILQYKGEWTYGPYALGGTVVVAVSSTKSTSSVSATLGSTAAAVVGAAYGSVVMDDESAANANTVAIQRALDSGGTISLPRPGTIWVNDALVVGPDTAFETGHATTIKMAGGSNACVLRNRSFDTAETTVTVALVAGVLATVSWASHGLVSGDAIALQDAVEPDWHCTFRVVHILDSDSFEILLPFYATASPTGTIKAKKLDRNIRLNIGVNYNYDENLSAVQGNDRMAVSMAFIADSVLNVRASNVYKYGLLTCATLNVRGEVFGDDCGDICKMYGPARDTHLHVSGMSRDDCATMQAIEPAAFIAYQPATGALLDCSFTLGTLTNSEEASSGLCVLYADDTYVSDGLEVRGGSLLSNIGNAIAIKNGDTFTTGQFGRVGIFSTAVGGEDGSFGVSVACSVDVLEIDGMRLVPSNGSSQVFRQESTSTIRSLIIRGFRFDESGYPGAASQFLFNLNGVIDSAEFVGCVFRGNTSYTRVFSVGPNGVKNVTVRGGSYETLNLIGIVQAANTVETQITLDGIRAKTLNNAVLTVSASRVYLRGNDFDTITQSVVRAQTAVHTDNVYDQGGNRYTSAAALSVANSALIIPHGCEMPVDIGATGITKAAGASCFNTGTGRGTIPQNRPVVCDGTNWFNATNLSHTF